MRIGIVAGGAAGLVIGLAVAVPVLTYDSRSAAWRDCRSDAADRVVRGCTAVLDRGHRETLQNRALARVLRGRAHRSRRRLDAALDDFAEAVRLRPSYPAALAGRAATQLDRGDVAAALADVAAALDLRADHADALAVREAALRLQRGSPSITAPSTEPAPLEAAR